MRAAATATASPSTEQLQSISQFIHIWQHEDWTTESHKHSQTICSLNRTNVWHAMAGMAGAVVAQWPLSAVDRQRATNNAVFESASLQICVAACQQIAVNECNE